jgi:hypothetical protein
LAYRARRKPAPAMAKIGKISEMRIETSRPMGRIHQAFKETTSLAGNIQSSIVAA